MYCLKCGNETLEEKIFCEECLQQAEMYPVKPGTAVQLPRRDSAKKSAPVKRSPSPEEQVEALRRAVRRLRLLLFLSAAALALTLGLLFNII